MNYSQAMEDAVFKIISSWNESKATFGAAINCQLLTYCLISLMVDYQPTMSYIRDTTTFIHLKVISLTIYKQILLVGILASSTDMDIVLMHTEKRRPYINDIVTSENNNTQTWCIRNNEHGLWMDMLQRSVLFTDHPISIVPMNWSSLLDILPNDPSLFLISDWTHIPTPSSVF